MKESSSQVIQTINDIALLLKSASLAQHQQQFNKVRNKHIDQQIMAYGLVLLYCIENLKGQDYQTQLEETLKDDPNKTNMINFLSQVLSIKPYIMQHCGPLQNLAPILSPTVTLKQSAANISHWRQQYNQENPPTFYTTQLDSTQSSKSIKQTLIDKLNSKILALRVAKFFYCCIKFNFSDTDTVYDKKIISLDSLLKSLNSNASALDAISRWRTSKTHTDIGQIENANDAKQHRYGRLDVNLWQLKCQWIPAHERADKTNTEKMLEAACMSDATLTFQCR